MVAPLIAAKAYAAAQAQASIASPAAAGAQGDGRDFASILKGAMTNVLQSSRDAEQKMVAHVQGKADMIDVVTAISSAQQSLETVMAVRDQVISAYKEILQMPI